jgi:hypothetical protein
MAQAGVTLEVLYSDHDSQVVLVVEASLREGSVSDA